MRQKHCLTSPKVGIQLDSSSDSDEYGLMNVEDHWHQECQFRTTGRYYRFVTSNS